MRRRMPLFGLGLCLTLWAVSGCSLFDTSTSPAEPPDPAQRLSGEYVLSLDAEGEDPQSTLLWLQIETVQIAGAPTEHRITGDIGYTASGPPGSLSYGPWYPVPGYVIVSEASEIEIGESPQGQQASQLPFTIVAELQRGEHGSHPPPAQTLCLEGEFDLEQRTATGQLSLGADCDQGDTIGVFAKNYNSSRSNNRTAWNPGGGEDVAAPVPATKETTFQGAAVTAQGNASLHPLDGALIAAGIGTGKKDRPALQDDGPFIRPSGNDGDGRLGRVSVEFPWIAPIPGSEFRFETVGVTEEGQERTLGRVTWRRPTEPGPSASTLCAEFEGLDASQGRIEVIADGRVTGQATVAPGCGVARAAPENGYNSSISNVGTEIDPDSSNGNDGIAIDLAFPGPTQFTLSDGTQATGTTLRLSAVELRQSVTGLTGVRIGGYRLGTIPITAISQAPIRPLR